MKNSRLKMEMMPRATWRMWMLFAILTVPVWIMPSLALGRPQPIMPKAMSKATDNDGYPASAGGDRRYEYISSFTVVPEGEFYKVTVKVICPKLYNSGGTFPDYSGTPESVGVWIDWNGDKIWDSSEQVLFSEVSNYSDILANNRILYFRKTVQIPGGSVGTQIKARAMLGWGTSMTDPSRYSWRWGDVSDVWLTLGVEPPSIYGVKVGPFADWDFSEGASAKGVRGATKAGTPSINNVKTLDNCVVLSKKMGPQPVRPVFKIRVKDRLAGNYVCRALGQTFPIWDKPVKVFTENGIQYGLYTSFEGAPHDYEGDVPDLHPEKWSLVSRKTYGAKKLDIEIQWTTTIGGKVQTQTKSETFEYFVFFDPFETKSSAGGTQFWYLLWKDVLPGLSDFQYQPKGPLPLMAGLTKSYRRFIDEVPQTLENVGKKAKFLMKFDKFVYGVTSLEALEEGQNVLKNKAGVPVFTASAKLKYFMDWVFETIRHENKHAEIEGQYSQAVLTYNATTKQFDWIRDGDPDNDGLNALQEATYGLSPNNPNTMEIVYPGGAEDQEYYVRRSVDVGASPAAQYYMQDWSYVGAQAPEALKVAFKAANGGAKSAHQIPKTRVTAKGNPALELDSFSISQSWYDAETAEQFFTYGEAPNIVFSSDISDATTDAAAEGLTYTIPVNVGTAGDLTFRAFLRDEEGNVLAEATTTGAFNAGSANIPFRFSADTMAVVAQKSPGPYVLDRVGCRMTYYLQGPSIWSDSPLMSGIDCSDVVWQASESYIAGAGRFENTTEGLVVTLPVYLPAAGRYTFVARLVPDGGEQAVSVAKDKVTVSAFGVIDVKLVFPADDIFHSKHTGAFRLHSLSVTSDDADVADWLVPNLATPSYAYTEFQPSEQTVFIDAGSLSDSILYDDTGKAVSLAVSVSARNSKAGQTANCRFKAILESEEGTEVARYNEVLLMCNTSDTYVLAFSGADIRGTELAGPYILSSLSIEDPETGEVLDALTSASWKTTAYSADTFSAGVSADSSSFALAEEECPAYNESGLRLSGMVELPSDGTVELSANLVTVEGLLVCSGHSETNCSGGNKRISLLFPSSSIFQSGLDGPYHVTSATVLHSSAPESPLVVPLNLETEAYTHEDFRQRSEVTATIGWKFLKATGTWFAQLRLALSAGVDEGLENLRYLFADRIGSDGKTAVGLWSSKNRAAVTATEVYGGGTYRAVALNPAALVAGGGTAVYGVQNLSADGVPVADRVIEMYVRKRVSPDGGNESNAGVDDFVGYVAWEAGGESHAVPVAAGITPEELVALKGVAVGTRGLSVPVAASTLNRSLAVGVALDDGAEPYCTVASYQTEDGRMYGTVEVGATKAGRMRRGALGANATVTLLGAETAAGPYEALGAAEVGQDGTFEMAVPEGAAFFRFRIDVADTVK